MALTYTIAGLQAQLDLVDTAVAAGNYEAARRYLLTAQLILSGVPESTSADGVAMRLRSLREALDLLGPAESSERAVDDRRLILTRLSHPR